MTEQEAAGIPSFSAKKTCATKLRTMDHTREWGIGFWHAGAVRRAHRP
jgi:hypothetical protein